MWRYASQPPQESQQQIGEELAVEGVVVANVTDCVVDALCVLTVDVDGKEFSVPYGYGLNAEGVECFESDTEDAFDAKAGDRIEIFGKFISEIELSPCNDSRYYIRSLEGDVSNWQTYRNEEYGFEFSHPEDMVISSSGTPGLVHLLWDGRFKMQIVVQKVTVLESSKKVTATLTNIADGLSCDFSVSGSAPLLAGFEAILLIQDPDSYMSIAECLSVFDALPENRKEHVVIPGGSYESVVLSEEEMPSQVLSDYLLLRGVVNSFKALEI